jgi:hypothetical protein
VADKGGGRSQQWTAMPTDASIHAFGGISFNAMNAPMNGMKTGAPTLRPNMRARNQMAALVQ